MAIRGAILVAMLAWSMSVVHSRPSTRPSAAHERYIVYMKRGPQQRGAAGVSGLGITKTSEEALDKFIDNQPEITKVHDLAVIGAKAVQTNNESAIAALSSLPGVARVEKDPVRYAFGSTSFSATGSSHSLSASRHLRAARALQSDATYGMKMVGADVTPFNAAKAPPSALTVCVMDSGVQRGHPGLAGVPLSGEPTSFLDECGHGTHVTGTVASRKGFGVAAGVGVHSVRVLGPIDPEDDMCYWAYASDLIAAAEECQTGSGSSKVIINMSLGGFESSAAEEEGLRRLFNAGVLFVAAAGNEGGTEPFYPASYEHVISVGAVDQRKYLADFSQRNAMVDLTAPGVGIYSSVPNSQYDYYEGTSMATPHVAGAAAIVWSYNLNWSNVQVQEALVSTAKDLGPAGRDDSYGHGLVNACRAAKLAGFDPENKVTCPDTMPTPQPTTAAPSPAPTPSTPTPALLEQCTPLEDNVDYLGNDLSNVQARQASDCCDHCSRTPGCQAFSWSDFNGGTCWLKSARGQAVVKPGVMSAALSTAAAANSCSPLEEDVDYVANDIGDEKRSTAEECCSVCRATVGCGAYTWSDYDGGTCWLKSQKGSTKRSRGVRSAVISSVCPSIEENVDYVAHDLTDVRRPRAEDCCDACRSTANCNAFSWNNYGGGTCWLKSRKGNTLPAPGVRSAVLLSS